MNLSRSLFATLSLAAALNASGANWTNYPYADQLDPSDTLLIGRTNGSKTNFQFSTMQLENWRDRFSVFAPTIQASLPTNDIYEAFPVLGKTPSGDRLFTLYYSSDRHAFGSGVLRLAQSTDYAATWGSSIVVATNAAADSRNPAFGVTSRGRLVLIYGVVQTANTNWLAPKFATSDDWGATWTNRGTISTNNDVAATAFSPYGQIRELNGKLYAGYYVGSTASAEGEIYQLSSTNWGESWQRTFIATNSSELTEPQILPITPDFTLAVARAENDTKYLQVWWTTNSGSSWNKTMTLPFSLGSSAARNPVALDLVRRDNGPEIIMVQGFRTDKQIAISSSPLTDAFSSTNEIGDAYEPGVDLSDSNPADGGYVSCLSLGSGEVLIAYYYATGSFSGVEASPNAQIRFARITAPQNAVQLTVRPGGSSETPFRVMEENGNPVVTVKKLGGVWSLKLDDQANHIGRLFYPTNGALSLHNEKNSAGYGASARFSSTNVSLFQNPGGFDFVTADPQGVGRFIIQAKTNLVLDAGTNTFFAHATNERPLVVADQNGDPVVTVRNIGTVWSLYLDDQTANHVGRFFYPVGGSFNINNANNSIGSGPAIQVSGSGATVFQIPNSIRLQAANGGAVYIATYNGSSTWTNVYAAYQTTRVDGKMQFNGGPTLNTGSGSPESSVTASIGSLYLRTDGGTSTTLYVKESGTGNTGWVAK